MTGTATDSVDTMASVADTERAKNIALLDEAIERRGRLLDEAAAFRTNHAYRLMIRTPKSFRLVLHPS